MPLFGQGQFPQMGGMGGLMGGMGAGGGMDPRSAMLLQLGSSLMGLQAAQDPGAALGRGMSSGMQVYQQMMQQQQQMERQAQFDQMRKQQFEWAQQDQQHQMRQREQQEQVKAAANANIDSAMGGEGFLKEATDPGSTPYSIADRDAVWAQADIDPVGASAGLSNRVLQQSAADRLKAEEDAEKADAARSTMAILSQRPLFAKAVEGLPEGFLDDPQKVSTAWMMYQDEQAALDKAVSRGLQEDIRSLSQWRAKTEKASSLFSDYVVTVKEPPMGEDKKPMTGAPKGEWIERTYLYYPGNEALGLEPKEGQYGNPDDMRKFQVLAGIEAKYYFDPSGAAEEAENLKREMKIEEDEEAAKILEGKYAGSEQRLVEGYKPGGKFMAGGETHKSSGTPFDFAKAGLAGALSGTAERAGGLAEDYANKLPGVSVGLRSADILLDQQAGIMKDNLADTVDDPQIESAVRAGEYLPLILETVLGSAAGKVGLAKKAARKGVKSAGQLLLKGTTSKSPGAAAGPFTGPGNIQGTQLATGRAGQLALPAHEKAAVKLLTDGSPLPQEAMNAIGDRNLIALARGLARNGQIGRFDEAIQLWYKVLVEGGAVRRQMLVP